MLIVDPNGLFEGERLAACSDVAQLHWQRLFLAANGYARLELSYSGIVSNVYRSFKSPPSENELWGFFEEYAANFLVVLYQSEGVWWTQFATSAKYMPRYKTARDESSPAPPLELLERHRSGYIEWKKAKSIQNQRFQKFAEGFGNVSKISAAVAVAVAVDVDVAVVEQKSCKELLSPSAQCEPVGSHDGEFALSNLDAPSPDSGQRGERKRETEIVERLFIFYCDAVGRDVRRYTLTKQRREKALLRLRERRKVHGDLESAEADLAKAIENLAASEYHCTNGYIDWLDQIFRSAEDFEKRLAWKHPVKGVTHAGANEPSLDLAQLREIARAETGRGEIAV